MREGWKPARAETRDAARFTTARPEGRGHVADCTAGHELLKRLPDACILHADKGTTATQFVARSKPTARCRNIPPKVNRRWKNTFSPARMFCRLNDFRRIATRCNRLAVNFLAAVCIAATVSYWL